MTRALDRLSNLTTATSSLAAALSAGRYRLEQQQLAGLAISLSDSETTALDVARHAAELLCETQSKLQRAGDVELSEAVEQVRVAVLVTGVECCLEREHWDLQSKQLQTELRAMSATLNACELSNKLHSSLCGRDSMIEQAESALEIQRACDDSFSHATKFDADTLTELRSLCFLLEVCLASQIETCATSRERRVQLALVCMQKGTVASGIRATARELLVQACHSHIGFTRQVRVRVRSS